MRLVKEKKSIIIIIIIKDSLAAATGYQQQQQQHTVAAVFRGLPHHPNRSTRGGSMIIITTLFFFLSYVWILISSAGFITSQLSDANESNKLYENVFLFSGELPFFFFITKRFDQFEDSSFLYFLNVF